MEARSVRAAIVIAAVIGLAADGSLAAGRAYPSKRSQHFVVSAPTAELATEICQAAETYRRDLAIEWLGQQLRHLKDPVDSFQ